MYCTLQSSYHVCKISKFKSLLHIHSSEFIWNIVKEDNIQQLEILD